MPGHPVLASVNALIRVAASAILGGGGEIRHPHFRAPDHLVALDPRWCSLPEMSVVGFVEPGVPWLQLSIPALHEVLMRLLELSERRHEHDGGITAASHQHTIGVQP